MNIECMHHQFSTELIFFKFKLFIKKILRGLDIFTKYLY